MKQQVERLVFTEIGEDDVYVAYEAKSPFGKYYIDHNKTENTFSSYCDYAEIGEDVNLIKAIRRVNALHEENIKSALV